jgi:arylsulfatase A-like enzyme
MVLAALGFFWLWSGPSQADLRRIDGQNVLLITIDTLRADALGSYGGPATTPALDRLAAGGVRFDFAHAQAVMTLPSHASILTGLLPFQHGLRDNSGYRLPANARTAATMLKQAGYTTAAFVAAFPLHSRFGLNAGFDVYDDHVGEERGLSDFNMPERPASAVVQLARDWIAGRAGGATLNQQATRPWFVWVHVFEPHAPYLPPPPFDRRFPPFPEPGRLAVQQSEWSPADRDWIVGQYDGEIAYGDQQFGRFVQALRDRGLYDRATIVFLADHGEEFLDHGEWQHGLSLFDELVRVPLVLKLPGRREAGRRVARQVQLVDVLPTILETEGLPVEGAIEGRPLDESYGATGPERPALFETSYFEHVAYGARTSEAKYVRRFHPADAELFLDLRRDPGERQARGVEGSPPARALKAAAEASLSSGAHHRVRVDGADAYDLRLRTTGWIEVVERTGLREAERAEVTDGGHALVLRLGRAADRQRRVEVELVARPHGAPVWIDGTRSGRRLAPSDVRVAAAGRPARSLPFLVPNGEELASELGAPFGPPSPATSGLSVWLVAPRNGRGVAEIDEETRESLKALGYLR